MELRFDYIDPQDDLDKFIVERVPHLVNTKIMQLSNDTSLYAALETMMAWAMKRGYRVRGWTIQSKPSKRKSLFKGAT
jgi:hypothetical protein